MAERRRIVSIAQSTGTVTTVKDLEDLTNYFTVRDTFTVRPGDRQVAYAQQSRRYAGSRAVSESHGNGSVSFQTAVRGSSYDNVIANVEALVGAFEQARQDLYLEWRPDGTSNSTYFEIRGPATWTPTYRWVQFFGSKSMLVDFTVPVGPLARGDKQNITVGALTLPATASVTIPGDAPALVDVSMTHSGGSAAPIWAMIGWHSPTATGSPTSGQFHPVGIHEAESFTNLVGWSVISSAPTWRGSGGLQAAPAGAYAYSANLVLLGEMDPDNFSPTANVELWGRIQVSSTNVSPKISAAVLMNSGALAYTAEYGSDGKLIVPPSSSTQFRFVRIGTLTIPDPAQNTTIRVFLSGGAGSSGGTGLDYLVVVPSRARALGPTGKANDPSYPDLFPSTASQIKVIRSDLSGTYGGLPDTGLGGSPIEMEPGVNTLVIKYSSLVPDDPTSDATTEQLSHALTACSLGVWPRYYLARGA